MDNIEAARQLLIRMTGNPNPNEEYVKAIALIFDKVEKEKADDNG